MYCKNCGNQLNEGQEFCTNCGFKASDGNKFCPNCGVSINPEQAVCINCGVALKSNGVEDMLKADAKLNGQSKLVMAILAFFLGGIGIHNFVMGETKKGIFKIVMSCCFGIGAILALIDFVRILADKYEVNPNKLF